MVDLWGGTPFNQTSGLINGHEDTWAVVTGLNLPMLIEAFASRMSMESAQEIAAHVYGVAKEGVRLLPEALEPCLLYTSNQLAICVIGCLQLSLSSLCKTDALIAFFLNQTFTDQLL